MHDFVRFAILGLGAGAMYTLSAQGLVMIYRGSGILNFAQAAMGMVGAYIFYDFRDFKHWPAFAALIFAIAMCMLMGALTQLVIMRRLRASSAIIRLSVTLGLLTLIQGLGIGLTTSDTNTGTRTVDAMLPQSVVTPLRGMPVSQDRLWATGIAIVATIGLTWFYRRTRFGVTTQAVAENPTATSAMGWSPDLIAAVNWALGVGFAGLASILVAPITSLSVNGLSLVILAALSCALVGGFRSFTLTMVAGFAIGITESEVTRFFPSPSGLGKAVPYLFIIAVLVLRGRALPLRTELSDRLPRIGTGQVPVRLLVVVVVPVLLLTVFVLPVAWTDSIAMTAATALIMLSVVVVTGYAGQMSLAQLGLAGSGGWIAAAVVNAHSWIPFPLALVIGTLAIVPVGLIVALPALRTRGVNLAIATLGYTVIVVNMIFTVTRFTGGSFGLNLGRIHVGWLDVDGLTHSNRYAAVCVAAFTGAALLVANLRRGTGGRRLIAVRSNERAATALGINVRGAKLYAFGLGAALAGLGGTLTLFFRNLLTGGISGGSFLPFSILGSVTLVLQAIVGGLGFLLGPVVAASLTSYGVVGRAFDTLGIIKLLVGLSGFIALWLLLTQPDGLVPLLARTIKPRAAARMRWLLETRHAPVDLSTQAREMVAPAVLEVRNVTVAFGGVLALSDVSLEVRPGEVFGLIGPNGAGKSTFIDAVTGFNEPRQGTIVLGGTDISAWPATRRARAGIGRSFQSLELFDDMTVLDNIRAACDRRSSLIYVTDLVHPGNPPLSGTAVAAIREFGLEDDLGRFPTDLPYGRRRLVAIARAVAASPSVILLDEPAAGLTETESAELGELIRRLAKDWGLAVLLIEHDVGLVMRVCDRICALDFGRQLCTGTPDEVSSDPAVIAAYLGEPESAEVRTASA